MWHDGEIDMEELEARLYSQVYHSTEGDIPTSKPNTVQENLSARTPKRYFGGNEMHRSPYGVYQRHPNNKHIFFEGGENVDSRQPPLRYNDPANFYDQVGLFTYPAVNNIVVLPQPPSEIYTRHQLERGPNYRRNAMRKKRHKLTKQKWKVERIKKGFKEHNLTTKNVVVEDKDDTSNSSNTSKEEIICVSESDSSDCEIEEPQVPSIVVSSDDEVGIKELHPKDVIVEIKNETISKISSGNDTIVRQPKSKEIETNDVQKSVHHGAVDDDDVVFVESSQNEILTICDESQSVTDANSSVVSNFTDNDPPVKDTVSSKVHTELLDTPESTNDFLDASFSSSHNNADVANNTKLTVNDFESDSNFSASDFDAPSRTAVFTEQEFDVAPKDSFSELNLDSFTSYIASKASTSIPSILTPAKRSASDMIKNNKSKGVRNSSDSSSESDYEDKVALVQGGSKNKRKISVGNNSLSSEIDDCVINDDCNNVKNKRSSLPNLSPITSDEETNIKENRKSDKSSMSKKKKQKKTAEDVRISGEKRKSVQNLEAKTKRTKQNEDDVDLNTLKSNEADKYFSSSDSEVEVIQIDGKSPCASPTNLDLELLNVCGSSTPIKQLSSATKPKRFSDYWTEDMKKFYCESWGHENFNLEEEQQAMSDDPTMWKIINNDETNFRILPRGPRCYRCRDFGHRAHNCTKRIEPPKCILCGRSGHLEARCPNKMCTSCGRKSQYSTTYCSRCANSRHVTCKICFIRGHTSSYCTDLWRRYHLTTTNGPLKQPNDSNLKPSKDRWCSGCASRGHFEFNCNYYNRTHPPANPLIRSYEDIYETHEPGEQTSIFSAQSRGGGGYYAAHPNQVSPWILGYPPNMYDQRFAQNFIQNRGPNPNFYQQFPVFQSMPNIFGMQPNLHNMFYPTQGDLVSTDAASTSQPEPDFEKNLVAEVVTKPNENEETPSGQKRDFLKLKDAHMRQLLSQDGLNFLKKIGKDSNVKIKIIKRKKKKKRSYWCMLEGAQEKMLSVKDSIRGQFKEELEAKPIDVMEAFNGKDFNMQVLQESVSKVDSSNTDWSEVADKLYQEIKEGERKLIGQGHKLKHIRANFKNQYIALNAILLGKVNFSKGRKHMKILREAVASPTSCLYDEAMLKQSYNFVFKNCTKFRNMKYNSAILELQWHTVGRTAAIDNLFKSGFSFCKDNNMTEELQRLEYLYKNAVFLKYSKRHVNKFTKFYQKIKQNGGN